MTAINLFDLIPNDLSEDPRYCVDWIEWEKEVATPALCAAGYEVKRWQTAEADSFGPLSRFVLLEKAGAASKAYYG